MKIGLILAAALSVSMVSGAHAESVTLRAPEALLGMVNRPLPNHPGGTVAPVPIAVAGSGKVTLTASDIWNRPARWRKDVDLSGGAQTVDFTVPPGYYHIVATVSGRHVAQLDIGVIPPFHPGVRKDSFFASNTSSVRDGAELRFLEAIGMKIQRAHFYDVTPEKMDEQKAHGTWVLPIVAYSLPGKETALAKQLRMYGPPADYQEFVDAWEKILRRFPEITTYEFWNEPWIFGWTWADTPAEYRRLQTMWCEMAHRVNPNIRVLAGNSWMFTQDHIEPYPDCWKNGLLQGTTHHPYSGADELSHHSGNQARSIDAGAVINREMGLPYHYLTEGGTQVGSEPGGPYTSVNNIVNARKAVEYTVRAAMSGCFQSNMQWGIGYGDGWTMSNTSFAVLTHFTEDRPIVADIWPANELLNGALFANPRFVTDAVRALPRAPELQARWSVPIPADRADDATKVAVIWSLTGPSADRVDTEGTITLPAAGLRAFDMVGAEIAPSGGQFVLPFTENPVYITSDSLSVIDLRKRIANARISRVTPINLYAQSLLAPATEKQSLIVRVENQLNISIQGRLSLQVAGRSTPSVEFAIPAAGLQDVRVPWPGATPDTDNRVIVSLKADLREGRTVARRQVIETARFVKRTIPLSGKRNDWQGITPVVMVASGQEDMTKYLLNPNLKPPAAVQADTRTAKVYTAYDDRFLYLGLEGWGTKTTAGEIARPGAPYRKGEPNGLDHIVDCGDVFQVAFGFRERVPQTGRQMDDPWAWKGLFYDTDYQYVAYKASDGSDHLVRQWGPDTGRQTAYQIDEVPFVGPVDGAKTLITGEIYEIAIPRSELGLFDPSKESLRFGFVLNGKYNWANFAGVFDHWMNSGSYSPAWETRLPCQTLFGIER